MERFCCFTQFGRICSTFENKGAKQKLKSNLFAFSMKEQCVQLGFNLIQLISAKGCFVLHVIVR